MRRRLHRVTSLLTSLVLVAGMATGILVASAASAAAAPGLDSSFEGLRSNLNNADPLNVGDDFTPGTKIAVGPSRVMEYVNDAVGIFSKSGSLLSALDMTDIFAATPGGTDCSAGDPNVYEGAEVIYDSVSDRWIIAVTATANVDVHPYGAYYECFAVSKTSNPEGSYYLKAVKLTNGGETYLQDERLGFWSTADGASSSTIWMGAGQYCDDCAGSSNVDSFIGTANGDWIDEYLGGRIWAFNVSDLESDAHLRWATTNGTGNLSGQSFQGPGNGASDPIADTIKPASMNVAAGIPPSGRNEIFTGSDYPVGGTKQEIWRATVNWTTSAITLGAATAATITTTFNFNYNSAFDSWVVEPSPGNVLDTNYDYTVGKLQYSNTGGTERLWLSQSSWSGMSAPTSGVGTLVMRQWNLSGNATPTANQAVTAYSNTPSDLTVNRWLPAGAPDKLGDYAMSYNVSSSSVNPGIRLTGREAGDTASTLQAETNVQTGSGYQVGTQDGDPFTQFGGSGGVGSAMVLDPDGCTFWGANEYLSSSPSLPVDLDSNTWNTKINSSHYASCTPSTLATSIGSVSATGLAGDSNSGDLTATLTANGTGSGVFGKTIGFSLGGNPVGSAVTNDNGVATLSAVDLSAYPAGTTAGDVSATFAGSGSYDSSSNTGDVLAYGATSQSVNFTDPGAKTYGDADFALTSAPDSGGPVTYTATGACKVNGSTAKIKRAGSCTITASQAGDDTYSPATQNQVVTIAKANQTITFPSLPAITTVFTNNTSANGNAYVNNATSDSNLPTLLDDSTGGNGCMVSGLNHIYAVAQATCTISANQAGDESYNAASPVTRTTSVTTKGTLVAAQLPVNATRRIDQADYQWYAGVGINLVQRYRPNPIFTVGNAGPFTVTASSGTGTVATLTFAAAPAHNMQVGTHVTVTGAGAYNCTNCTVTAVAATTISYASAATGAGGVGGTVAQSLTVCTGAIDPDGTNAVLVNTLHTGSCSVVVGSAATGSYNAVANTTFNKGIQKGTQGSVTWSPATGSHQVPGTFNVTATLNPTSPDFTQDEFDAAGLVPTVAVTSGGCTVANASTGTNSRTVTVTPTSSGSCILNATNAGNDDWAARSAQNSPTYTITKGDQTITGFGTIADHTYGDADFDVSPGVSATSGLPVTFSANGDCTATGAGVVHITGAGSCTVHADQAGNGAYNPAPQVDQSFTINKADQTISFGSIPDHTFGDPDFGVTATASSGLTVTFTASGDCGVTGVTVHLTGGGSCTISAHQAGDANYNQATNDPVDQTFTIYGASQTVMIDPIPDHTYGDADFSVSATASSNLDVYFTAVGDCTVSGDLNSATVHITGAGSCTVTGHQDGDDDYGPASADSSFNIAKADQTITGFGSITDRAYGSANFNVSGGVSATSGLGVTFSADPGSVCTTTGAGVVHITGGGVCTVHADQAGNANYNAAPQVDQSFTVTPRATTIKFRSMNPTTVASGNSVTLKAKATGTGIKAVGTVEFRTGATVLASGTINNRGRIMKTVTISLAPGTYPVKAYFIANANFQGSTSPQTKTLNVT